MGYYVHITDCKVTIRRSNFQDACNHLLNIGFLNDNDKMKGCKYDGEKVVERYYAWVNMKNLRDCLVRGSLPEVFAEFGFGYFLDNSGNIVELSYDAKSGDEQHLLHCLREFFDEGDFIEWTGEENALWRNSFQNTYMYVQNPITVWSNVEVFK